MAGGHRSLYERLKADKLYTKSYEEFTKQFADPDRLYTLYNALRLDGFYTRPIEEFKQKFWPPEPEKYMVSVKDKREVDSVTGMAMTDTNRMHADIDSATIKHIAERARKYKVDPYTAMAIGIQETGLSSDFADNPFRLFNMVSNLKDLTEADDDIIDFSMKKMAEKIDYAKKLGKKTDEDIIQAWNGYGKIKKGTEGLGDKAYGIDISKEPIDMGKNPVYGKRVKDIRDNILKKNPEIVELVNSTLSPTRK
jgi:hypothetical protein